MGGLPGFEPGPRSSNDMRSMLKTSLSGCVNATRAAITPKADILLIWYPGWDSNPQNSVPKTDMLCQLHRQGIKLVDPYGIEP